MRLHIGHRWALRSVLKIRSRERTSDLNSIYIRTAIRAEGYNAQGTGKAFAGGTLRSFSTVTRTELAVLGVIPNDIGRFTCATYGALVEMLCEGRDAAANSDLFFLNAETAINGFSHVL